MPNLTGGRRRTGPRRSSRRGGRRVLIVGLTRDVARHAPALERIARDRVVVEERTRSAEELEALADRIVADDAELQTAGYTFLSVGSAPDVGSVLVDVVGGDDAAAAAFLHSRYGDAVQVEWLGRSRMQPVPLPFGSWTSDATTLRVFYGLDHNGEQFESAALVQETADRVVVALTRLQPVGPTTLIGGFQPRHADLELSRPVGEREVIDASTGRARPSLAQLRAR